MWVRIPPGAPAHKGQLSEFSLPEGKGAYKRGIIPGDLGNFFRKFGNIRKKSCAIEKGLKGGMGMSVERFGIVRFNNQDVTVVGKDLKKGDRAPEFTAIATDWSSVRALESTRGKVRIIGSLLSLNTSVCDEETKRFNQEAAGLSEDIAILMVSMDLPWTQKNWCGSTGVDRVITLSDHRDVDFGGKYGVLLKEPRILRRAIFVVDRDDRIVYADYMKVLGDQPDYTAVREAARRALA